MASFFGITSAKYQYAIDEYYRMKKEVRPAVAILPNYPNYRHFPARHWLTMRRRSLAVASRGRRRRRRTGCRRRRSDPASARPRWRTKTRPPRREGRHVWRRLASTGAARCRARAWLRPASSPCQPSSRQPRQPTPQAFRGPACAEHSEDTLLVPPLLQCQP